MVRERGSGVTPPRVVELLTKEVSEKSMLAVSKATGIGLAAIGRYLKGVGEPTTKTLQKLAEYFKVSVPWLRGDILIKYEDESYHYKLKKMSPEEKKEHFSKIINSKQEREFSSEEDIESIKAAHTILLQLLLSRKKVRDIADIFITLSHDSMRNVIDLLELFYKLKKENPSFKLPDIKCPSDKIE